MNIQNLLVGICMIAVGLILDIYMFFKIKKLNASWKILIFIFFTNVIARILWLITPENVMPHCLVCFSDSEGYIWDKNEIKDITVVINSLYGALLCIYVNSIKNLKKEKVIKNILAIIVSISIIIIMAMFSLATRYV